jgi:hypothetical protein
MSKLLIEDRPLQCLPKLAQRLGSADRAIILQQIHYLMQAAEEVESEYKFVKGVWWVYNTYKQWRDKYFVWLSERKIQTHILALEKGGYLETMQSVKNKSDRTKWYTINYRMLEDEINIIDPSHQNGTINHDTDSVPSIVPNPCDGYTKTPSGEKTPFAAKSATGENADGSGGQPTTCKCTNLVDCMAGTKQCLDCGTIIGEPYLDCVTCGKQTPHNYSYGGYSCKMCTPQLSELSCPTCDTAMPFELHDGGERICVNCDTAMPVIVIDGVDVCWGCKELLPLDAKEVATVPVVASRNDSNTPESSEPEQSSVGTRDNAAHMCVSCKFSFDTCGATDKLSELCTKWERYDPMPQPSEPKQSPTIPRLDASERIIFNSLTTKQRATIATLSIDPLHSIVLNNSLNNNGCLRPIAVAPNMKQLYVLSERGNRFAVHLNPKELERARKMLADKQAKATSNRKSKRNANAIECPIDVAPYASLVSQVFYGGALWDDMLATEHKFIIKHVNILRKKYSVDDCEYAFFTWLPAQKWETTPSLAAFTNGKGHMRKAIEYRNNRNQAQAAQNEYEIVMPDDDLDSARG